MKAGLAAAAAAMKAVTDSGVALRGDLIVAGVAGEIEKVEVGESRGRSFRGYGVGTEYLVKHGQLADAAIIGEPTGFQVSTGHLGALWLELTVFGEFQHTARSFVSGFRHAVHAALPALVGLQQWVVEYNQRTVYKGATCAANIAAIRAGDAWRASRTPQECRIFLDIRYQPGRSPMEVRDELESVIGGILGPSGSGSWTLKPYLSVPPAEISPNEPFVTELQRTATGVIGREVDLGFQGPMNDAGTLINAGIPAVCFGVPTASKEFRSQHPGESVRIADVVALAEVYARFAQAFCA
jgi:acetylornithine deacetylase/succinyl-diaminopimelate desuccinylase-like protein